MHPTAATTCCRSCKFLGDTLVVQDKGKAVLTGRKVRPAPAGAFGPVGFEAAFTSEVAPGEMMSFVLTRDANGLYATVDGNPRVMETLPAALNGKRVRHCDPNRNAAPGSAAAGADRPAGAAEGRGLQAGLPGRARHAGQGALAGTAQRAGTAVAAGAGGRCRLPTGQRVQAARLLRPQHGSAVGGWPAHGLRQGGARRPFHIDRLTARGGGAGTRSSVEGRVPALNRAWIRTS